MAEVLSQNARDLLEAWIDKHGLSEVVATIADLCDEKAQHIRTNWQDEQTASVWESAARHMNNADSKIPDTLKL